MSGPDAYSIAALLPPRPPAGARIVVAGRPDPPVPRDVPHDHPLRDPRVARCLEPSAHARVIRMDAERELKRLLHGAPVERDLLGLVTAAGGGLSGSDLAALTGLSQWEVEERLHTVAGRTFASRSPLWQPNAGVVVYVLAHEDLRAAALRYLGDGRLAEFRERLHVWADGYRGRGWPADTPEYLLHGYFQLLAETREDHRLIACALDQARHERILDITGGDIAALNEIATAQGVICLWRDPDLATMLVLAAQRDHLTQRNTNVSANLPAAWAMLGHPVRAEALARSITDRHRRVEALAELAGAQAETGDLGQARKLLDLAEEEAISLSDEWARARVALIRAAVAIGDAGRADALAGSLADPYRRVWALVEQAVATWTGGDLERARRVADRAGAAAAAIDDPGERTRASIEVIRARAAVGDLAGAEAVAGSVTNPYWRVWARVELVGAIAACGDLDRAEAMALSLRDPGWRGWAMIELVDVLVAAGELDRARDLAVRARDVAEAVAETGQGARALARLASAWERLWGLGDAWDLARSFTQAQARMQALAALAVAATGSDEPERAEALTASIEDAHWRVWVAAEQAKRLAAAGELKQARDLAARAELMVRAGVDPGHQARRMVRLIENLVAAGDLDQARGLAVEVGTAITADPRGDIGNVIEVAEALLGAGQAETAHELAVRAASRAQAGAAINAPAVMTLARVLATVGEPVRAEALARSLPGSGAGHALVCISEAYIASGQFTRAEESLTAIPEPAPRDRTLTALVIALANARHFDRAEILAPSIIVATAQARALIELVKALSAAGQPDRARRLADRARTLARRTHDDAESSRLLAELASACSGTDAPHSEASAGDGRPGGPVQTRHGAAHAHAHGHDHGERAINERLRAFAGNVGWAGASAHAEDLTHLLASLAEHAALIVHPQRRARAILSIAEAGGPDVVRRLIAFVLHLAPWDTPLEALAVADPSALSAAASAYLASSS
ncbi:hypothetical protein ACNF49_41155 [Actinomadura sp. ATCC 39365]